MPEEQKSRRSHCLSVCYWKRLKARLPTSWARSRRRKNNNNHHRKALVNILSFQRPGELCNFLLTFFPFRSIPLHLAAQHHARRARHRFVYLHPGWMRNQLFRWSRDQRDRHTIGDHVIIIVTSGTGRDCGLHHVVRPSFGAFGADGPIFDTLVCRQT